MSWNVIQISVSAVNQKTETKIQNNHPNDGN